MFIEEFKKNKQSLDLLASAQSALFTSGYFAVAHELGLARPAEVKGLEGVERLAIQTAWSNGYIECLRDLFYFGDRYMGIEGKKSVRSDFGVLDNLVRKGEITKEERDELTTAADSK